MTNLVTGMKIEISEPVFAGSFRNPKFLGNRQIIGQIVKESYGNKRGQHTFTIDVECAEGMYAEDVLQKRKYGERVAMFIKTWFALLIRRII